MGGWVPVIAASFNQLLSNTYLLSFFSQVFWILKVPITYLKLIQALYAHKSMKLLIFNLNLFSLEESGILYEFIISID